MSNNNKRPARKRDTTTFVLFGLVFVALFYSITGTVGMDRSPADFRATPVPAVTVDEPIAEDGWYYSAEDVALYLSTYDCLPENFITKDEAEELGWDGGNLEEYAPGYAIGGDYFGNYEELLPEAPGRDYYECDINTDGADSRGAERIVYSDDGLIYYTDDHYESFTLLYDGENATNTLP